MKERATEFPESEQPALLKAAKLWRLPYWDVAMKKPDARGNRDYDVPLVFRLKEVDIRQPVAMMPSLPGLKQAGFPNALYQFTMPGGINMGNESLGDLKIVNVEGDIGPDKQHPDPVTIPVSLPDYQAQYYRISAEPSSSLETAGPRADTPRLGPSMRGLRASRTTMVSGTLCAASSGLIRVK